VPAALIRASECSPLPLSTVSARCVPPCLISLSTATVHRKCPLRSSVPQSAVHRHCPPYVPVAFLHASVLTTAAAHRKCPLHSSVPQCCPPPLSTATVHRKWRFSVPQSAVHRKCLRVLSHCKCPIWFSVPQALPTVSARCVSPCLPVSARQCPRCVPPCLRARSTVSARAAFLRASECCPPSVPMLPSSVPQSAATVSARCIPSCLVKDISHI